MDVHGDAIPLRSIDSTDDNMERGVITDEKEANGSESENTPLAGLPLYFKAMSAIIGAGVLFMHAGVIGGGLIAWIIAMVVYLTSAICISEVMYRYRRQQEEEVIRSGNYQILERGTRYEDLAKNSGSTIRLLLDISIFAQAIISVIVYLRLMFGWIREIVGFVKGVVGFGDGWELFFLIMLTGAIIGFCGWLSTWKKPGDYKSVPIISTIAMFLLLGLLALVLGIVFFGYPSTPAYDMTFPSKQMLPILTGSNWSFGEFVGAISIFLFAINSLPGLPVYQSQQRVTNKRGFIAPPVVAVCVTGVVFLLIGIAGYLITYLPPSFNFDPTGDILDVLGKVFHHKYSSETCNLSAFLYITCGLTLVMLPMICSAFMWQIYLAREMINGTFTKVRNSKSLANTWNSGKNSFISAWSAVRGWCVIAWSAVRGLFPNAHVIDESTSPTMPQSTLDENLLQDPRSITDKDEDSPPTAWSRLKTTLATTWVSLGLPDMSNLDEHTKKAILGVAITGVVAIFAYFGPEPNYLIKVVSAASTAFITLFLPAYFLMFKVHIRSDERGYRKVYDYIVILVLLVFFVVLFGYLVIYKPFLSAIVDPIIQKLFDSILGHLIPAV